MYDPRHACVAYIPEEIGSTHAVLFDRLAGLNKKQHAPLSEFSTAGSKFVSIVRRAWMVSAGDNEIYTGLNLRGVIPYVQCGAAVFLS
jgi:hypothetical protein